MFVCLWCTSCFLCCIRLESYHMHSNIHLSPSRALNLSLSLLFPLYFPSFPPIFPNIFPFLELCAVHLGVHPWMQGRPCASARVGGPPTDQPFLCPLLPLLPLGHPPFLAATSPSSPSFTFPLASLLLPSSSPLSFLSFPCQGTLFSPVLFIFGARYQYLHIDLCA